MEAPAFSGGGRQDRTMLALEAMRCFGVLLWERQ